MSSESENRLTANPSPGETPLAGTAGEHDQNDEAPGSAEPRGDRRLDRMPLQLDVMVKVRAFRVGDLLELSRGAVVETMHEHSQDVPVRCGGVVLVWAEFEVVEQKLSVRITRLAQEGARA